MLPVPNLDQEALGRDDLHTVLDLLLIAAPGAEVPQIYIEAPGHSRPFFPPGCCQVPGRPGAE